MEEKEKKKKEIVISKSTYFNNQNKTNQNEVDKMAHEGRSLSVKKDNSKNNNNEIPIKTAIKKINLSPEARTYQTQTFNSHTPLNSRLNIDALSDKNGSKEIPMSREKKIYLYLTNNNTGNNNSDPTSVFDTPKTIFKKPEENIEKLSLEDGNKEEIDDIFNKTNIINNINNNNVNNIFVNFISSNAQTNLSRNIIEEQNNNSFDGKRLKNNIYEDDLNKGSIQKLSPRDSKTIFIRDRQTKCKIMTNNTNNKEDRIKSDRLDYYSKIMNTSNSFIFDKINNHFEELKELKIAQKNKLSLNKTINNEEKITEIDSNRFLKNYIKNKSKNLKNLRNNKIKNNLRRYNNSISSAKAHDFSNNIFNHNNPIFINIISKNPFQEEIDEENEFNLTISSRKNEKIISNSNTTKFLNSKYNNLKSPFIYSNRNNPNNIYQNYNISKNNLNNNIKKKNSFYRKRNINNINNYSSININDKISYKNINNSKKKLFGNKNIEIISDSIVENKEKITNKIYSSAFNTIDSKINNQSIVTNNNIINIDIIRKNKNINDRSKDNIKTIVNDNIINSNDINKKRIFLNTINTNNIKKKSNIKKKKKRCAEIINNINELNDSINNINNKNKALYNNTNLIFIKSNKKKKKSRENNRKDNITNKLFNETYNKNNNIIFISNRDNFKSLSTEKRNIINFNNNLNNKFDNNIKNNIHKDNNTDRKNIKNNNTVNLNIQNKNSVIKNINNDINKKINNINNNNPNNNNIDKKTLSNLSTDIIGDIKTNENNKTFYNILNANKKSSIINNNINDMNNKTITNNSNNYLKEIINKNLINTKNIQKSKNLISNINKKNEIISINKIINKNNSTKNNANATNTIINKINILSKKDTNIKNNINNNTKIYENNNIKNMNNTTKNKNKNSINDNNLINDDEDLTKCKSISSKNVVINNFNPSNNTVSFIDGNSEKKNTSNKKNEFSQIYTNNNKNINFVKAKNNTSIKLTDNDSNNKKKSGNKNDKKGKKDNKNIKDNKDNKKDDLKNKNKIKKVFQNTFSKNINQINTFIKKEEKKDIVKNKNNSIVQINYSNGIPKKIFEQKNNIINNNNNNKNKNENNITEEINILKNFNNNSSIVVSPTKGIIATNTLVYDEENEEKGIFIHRLRGKSTLIDVPKKKCEICNNMIETHLFKIHLNSHPTEIFNWMYLGTYQNACDIKELRRLGINCILNCASECLNNKLPEDIKELHLHIRDEEDFDLIPYFEDANVFINKARLLGENILIHCKFGISRSVSFIMAYLIKYLRFNVQGALNYVRRRRKQINPNQGFLDQLIEYEKYIKAIKK